MPDRRVVHFWAESRSVGIRYARALESLRPFLAAGATGLEKPVPVLWDAYLLYTADARWNDEHTGLVRWGRTVLATRQTLLDEVDRLR